MSRELEVVTMMYALMGLVSAVFFGIGAVTVYGAEGLLANLWVDYMFWWLIGTGVLLALVESVGQESSRLDRGQVPHSGAGEAATSHWIARRLGRWLNPYSGSRSRAESVRCQDA